MSARFSCNAFGDHDWGAYEDGLREKLRQEIHDLPKEYVLRVDETEFERHLADKYSLVPLEIFQESEHVTPRTEQQTTRDGWGDIVRREVYVFRIRYKFSGSAVLFKLRPNPRTLTSHPIEVDEAGSSVAFDITIGSKEPDQFRRERDQAFRASFTNVTNVNQNVATWNNALLQLATQAFGARKKHFAAENDFFAAINIPAETRTAEIFTVPTIKRRIIPRPEPSKNEEYKSQPTMSDEMYEDALKVLYQTGQAMERKPSLYRAKQEEDLRDQFLLFLETRYSATTGSAETFNKAGKTDILLKYEDGTNLFVAECKWWSGESDFRAAINQLFDRYLTWRDSKAALLVFVRNKGFSAIAEKARTEATKHPYFVRARSNRAETSFAFEFHLPSDDQRLVHFAILLFAFPE